MTTLLEFIGLGDVTGLDLIFGITALVGTVLFLIWFVLMMLGGVMGDVGEAIFGADIGMDADLSFKALTFQGIAAFMMMFGLVGLWVSRGTDSQAMGIIVGGGAGGASMFAVSKIMTLFKEMETSGTADINNAIGETGEVYMRIPANGKGQVQVPLQGTLRTLDAMSATNEKIDTGTLIVVTKVLAGVLVVKPLSASDDSEE
tara:strand:- start:792 stop:1397 length:606 start_codon:yes stop_codon:yes gene_type:complete